MLSTIDQHRVVVFELSEFIATLTSSVLDVDRPLRDYYSLVTNFRIIFYALLLIGTTRPILGFFKD